ncbi:hypothetical protein KI387_019205, partial [Taxus chinensis]
VGLGAGVVLYSPLGELYPFSYKLKFDNANNTVESEALLLVMDMVKDMGIKKLRCQSDVEVIV